jgi:hypothetical protein
MATTACWRSGEILVSGTTVRLIVECNRATSFPWRSYTKVVWAPGGASGRVVRAYAYQNASMNISRRTTGTTANIHQLRRKKPRLPLSFPFG